MGSAWFALSPAGLGCWSTRLFDALSTLTVPVLLSNGALLPFASFLNYSEFSLSFDTHLFLTSTEACVTAVGASPANRSDACPLSDTQAERAGAKSATSVLSAGAGAASEREGGALAMWSRLHSYGDAIREQCSSDDGQPTGQAGEAKEAASIPVACEALLPIQMMKRLAEVRSFFQYDPGERQSAWGLFLLELQERKAAALQSRRQSREWGFTAMHAPPTHMPTHPHAGVARNRKRSSRSRRRLPLQAF
mmetsp:Transcript_40481/g.81666  ORF Transcript_40481/g.81666 Transcript_40481/m.81666 type:complete len:250 (+) Transcript_40481:236-985(+)